MGWGGKILGGIIGFAVGGPIGAMAGAALGHNWIDRESDEGGPNGATPSDRMMEAFKIIFAMLGKLAKSDGQVTQVEVQVIDRFAVGQLGLNPEQRRVLAAAFNESRSSNVPFESYAHTFHRMFGANPNAAQGVIELFMQVATADGRLDAAEERLILTAVDIFGLPRGFYQQVRERYVRSSGGDPGAAVDDLDRCYEVLGCSRQDSAETIKSNYRKLVHEYHPDTIAGKGLPQGFTEFAHQKFCEIQEAYEKIMETRKAG